MATRDHVFEQRLGQCLATSRDDEGPRSPLNITAAHCTNNAPRPPHSPPRRPPCPPHTPPRRPQQPSPRHSHPPHSPHSIPSAGSPSHPHPQNPHPKTPHPAPAVQPPQSPRRASLAPSSTCSSPTNASKSALPTILSISPMSATIPAPASSLVSPRNGSSFSRRVASPAQNKRKTHRLLWRLSSSTNATMIPGTS